MTIFSMHSVSPSVALWAKINYQSHPLLSLFIASRMNNMVQFRIALLLASVAYTLRSCKYAFHVLTLH
jgi:hypothetical protein